MIFKVFMAILETFLVFGIGAWIFHKGMLADQDLKKLTTLTMDVFFPMLTFATIVQNFNKDNLNELWIMPVAGFGIMALSFLIGWPLKRFMRNSTRRRRGTFHHICAINNYVFLPLIVLQSIYGSRHVALLLLMNVGSTVGLWTVGIIAFKGGTTWERTWRSVFSINIVAVFVAVLWSVLPVPIPDMLVNVSRSLGNLSVPFMLILVGCALYQCYDKLLDNKLDLLYISVMRLVVIPLVLVLVLSFLPIPRDIFEVLFVVALMPAASSSVLFAKQHGGASEFAGQVILATTILSLGTIPLMMKLFL